MPLIRLLIAAVAVVFGLIVAAIVAVFGVALFIVARLLGKRGPQASFKFNFQRGAPAANASRRSNRMSPDGAIDIEATEIEQPSSPAPRLER